MPKDIDAGFRDDGDRDDDIYPFQVVHRKLGTSRQVVRQGVCIWGHAMERVSYKASRSFAREVR